MAQIKTFDLLLTVSALAALIFLLPADREAANFDKSDNSAVSSSTSTPRHRLDTI